MLLNCLHNHIYTIAIQAYDLRGRTLLGANAELCSPESFGTAATGLRPGDWKAVGIWWRARAVGENQWPGGLHAWIFEISSEGKGWVQQLLAIYGTLHLFFWMRISFPYEIRWCSNHNYLRHPVSKKYTEIWHKTISTSSKFPGSPLACMLPVISVFFSAHFGHFQRRSPSRSGMSCKTKLRPAGVHDVLCDAQVHLFWLIPSLYVLSSTFPDIPAFVSMILIVVGGQHESNWGETST